MRPSSTARRYAEAAFDVAGRDGDADRWVQELEEVASAIQRPEVAAFFQNPDVSMDQKMNSLEGLFGHVRPHALNLLRILILRQRVHLLPTIVREFVAVKREAEGIAEAYVTVARPIEDSDRHAIAERLGELTGKRIEIHIDVDPSILGGVVVRIGDKLIDASVAGRLQRLRQEMAV